MLDTATKRRIDDARDILVGKVPDPKSQVEQITIALIYKFMADMDAEAEELGGRRTFFADQFAKYGWAQLMHSGLGGHETLNLYAEAIARMPENAGIPPLFRDIFKNAYLPYRDPETLRSFLKIIDEFHYDHSERLGDAFEYLLSVLGSQGDAGQFRTPRHIIDFIVAVVDPKKGDSILDPACGTAGFLISAWKHIQSANRGVDGELTLTPEEQERLANNINGYDISPDMVRLSLVNLYLHGFNDPHIVEYDTLSSDDRWNERADIILANPPFMTPKGGIRPHNRFSITSSKSEVLFLDYFIEHLTREGRMGIVVPDGILSNPSRSFKTLREMCIRAGLHAVVGLHNHVFKPYAGAKTAILFFDKKKGDGSQPISFFELQNDGFEKGEQRRPITGSQLPALQAALTGADKIEDDLMPAQATLTLEELDANVSLSPSTYLFDAEHPNLNYMPLGAIFSLTKGTVQSKKANPGEFTFVTASESLSTHTSYTHEGEAIVIAVGAGGSLGRTHHIDGKFVASDLCLILRQKSPDFPVDYRFYNEFFRIERTKLVSRLAKGVSKPSISKGNLSSYRIPYIPHDVQTKIGKRLENTYAEIDRLEESIADQKAAARVEVLEGLLPPQNEPEVSE